jgi:hypothetical protein
MELRLLVRRVMMETWSQVMAALTSALLSLATSVMWEAAALFVEMAEKLGPRNATTATQIMLMAAAVHVR